MRLWTVVRPRLDKIWPNSLTTLDAVEEKLVEFEGWDKDSFAFRYPVTKAGEPTLSGLSYINVRHLRDVVGGIAIILDGSFYGLDDMLDVRNEMEAEFRREMSQYYGADIDEYAEYERYD
jgi:hypothetical protein